MSGPPWFVDALASLMMGTALYCLVRLMGARRRIGGMRRDVDALHVAMGVVMTGMLIPALSFGWSWMWGMVFGAGAAWFGWQVLRSRVRPDISLSVHDSVAHVVSCGAMCLMVAVGPGVPAAGASTGRPMMGGSDMGGMAGMEGGSSGSVWVLPVWALVAALLAAYAIYHLGSLVTSAHIVTGRRSSRDGRQSDLGSSLNRGHAQRPDIATALLSPRLARCCTMTMLLAMTYMMIMLPKPG